MRETLFGEKIPSKKVPSEEVIKLALITSFPSKVTAKGLVGKLYSKHEAVMAFYDLCRGEAEGHKISMLFNPHRFDTRTKKGISIVEALNTKPGAAAGIARVMWSRRDSLYSALQLGATGYRYVGEFPPHVARDHFISFAAQVVLDPCAGWGGRMIGAASLGIRYVACEPATKTYEGLLLLGEWLQQFKTGFTFKVINKPFEDTTEKELGPFDLAYTSPPYYDTEHYSDEETNSFNRYETFEAWVAGFYVPMVRKALHLARKGFVLNVGHRTYDLLAPLKKEFVFREIPTKLSGKLGIGRKIEGKESFYLVTGEQ